MPMPRVPCFSRLPGRGIPVPATWKPPNVKAQGKPEVLPAGNLQSPPSVLNNTNPYANEKVNHGLLESADGKYGSDRTRR
jgi:hypothetical protein